MLLKSWSYSVDELSWIPLVALSWSVFSASLAVLTFPSLINMEILPKNVKEFGIVICDTTGFVLVFATTKLLPLLIDKLKFHGCMFSFAGCCLFGALVIFLYVPETKGKTHEQIMESLK